MSRSSATIVRSPRLTARRRAVRAERRRRRRRIALATILIAASAAGAYALTRSSVFGLDEIQVAGAVTVSEKEVIAASGLRRGQNMLGIDLHEVEDRVRSLPEIDDVLAERVDNVTIRLTVQERRAAVEIRAGTRRWLLDPSGDVIKRAAKRPPGVPVIVLRAARQTKTPPTEAVDSIPVILTLWERLPEKTRTKIRSFEPILETGIVFRYAKTRVIFGPADQIEEKLAALTLVRKRVAREDKKLLQIDLRAPSHPAARIA